MVEQEKCGLRVNCVDIVAPYIRFFIDTPELNQHR